MGSSSSYVSAECHIVCVVIMVIFSLGYEGEEVPGEVKALEINPVTPQQVCHNVSIMFLCHQNFYSIEYLYYQREWKLLLLL